MMPATKQAFPDRKLDEAAVKDGGKLQLIIQEKVDVEKPSLEEDVITRHEEDADGAPTVENFHNLIPTKRWGVEEREAGGYDLHHEQWEVHFSRDQGFQ